MRKSLVIKTLSSFDDEFDVEKFIERLLFAEKVEKGLSNVKEDRILDYKKSKQKLILGKSNLILFLRPNLEILFVGLNPAKGSSDNGHYFSVKQSFWDQLYKSGLLTNHLNKAYADTFTFKSNIYNYKNWNYGITDLVTEYAESDSGKVKPKKSDYQRLEQVIKRYKPLTVVLLHGTVLKGFCNYINQTCPKSNTGNLGKLIPDVSTVFFNIAFPHGNAISDLNKIHVYKQLKKYVESQY